MAITIKSTAQLFQPVYNPLWYSVSSSNTGQPNFKFVFDVYSANTSANTYVSRVRLMPDPNSINCTFSPSELLKDYLSFDLTQGVTIPVNNTGCCRGYLINFGEDYGASITATTIYSALTWASAYTWNAVLQYEEVPTFDYKTFWLTGSTSRFLTNAPKSQYIRNGERLSLTYFNFLYFDGTYNVIPEYLRVRTYQTSGGNKTFYIINKQNTGTTFSQTTSDLIQHIGVGPWNLSNIPFAYKLNSNFINTTSQILNVDTDSKYDVTWQYAVDQPPLATCSETLTFVLDTRCTPYDKIRLMWLNPLGGMDFATFALVNRISRNIQRNEYKSILSAGYQVGERQNTTTYNLTSKSRMVTSDFMTDAESTWLQELYNSVQAYEIQADGSLWPIILIDNNPEEKTRINEKLVNYQIKYQYSFDINGQRN